MSCVVIEIQPYFLNAEVACTADSRFHWNLSYLANTMPYLGQLLGFFM